MRVLAFVSDLMFRSKIDATAKAGGATVSYPQREQDPAEAAVAAGADLVVIDIGYAGGKGAAIVGQVRVAAPKAVIVAFGSHVDEKGFVDARAAGADEVMPRSAFARRLGELLADIES